MNSTTPSYTITNEDLRIIMFILSNMTDSKSSNKGSFSKANSVFIYINSQTFVLSRSKECR